MRRAVPHPLMSGLIVALWMLLADTPSIGNLVLGIAAGLVLPWLTQTFWPVRTPVKNPLVALRLAAVVLADIIRSDFIVAAQILGPPHRLMPDFVDVPLDVDDPFVATLLGSIISMTPGTLTTAIDIDRRTLRLHALHVPDPSAVIRDIKTRYEQPLKEAFGC